MSWTTDDFLNFLLEAQVPQGHQNSNRHTLPHTSLHNLCKRNSPTTWQSDLVLKDLASQLANNRHEYISIIGGIKHGL